MSDQIKQIFLSQDNYSKLGKNYRIKILDNEKYSPLSKRNYQGSGALHQADPHRSQ